MTKYCNLIGSASFCAHNVNMKTVATLPGHHYGAPFVKVFRTDYSEPRLAGGGAIQVWLVGVASIVTELAPGSETFLRLIRKKIRDPSRHVRC